MKEALKLYEYQEGILDLLRLGFQQGHRTQILVAPTGAGKTEMAIALLRAAAARGNRAAMLLDRIVLCDQTSQRLQKYGIDHGVMQSGHWRYRPYESIQICSAQTIEKRGSFPGLKVLIVDEAHQTRKQTVGFIKNNPEVRVIGLTATPFTEGLGAIYSNVVSSVTTRELVQLGRLAPLRVYVAKEIDMTGVKKVAGEWSQDEVTERGLKITGDIVTEWVKKTHEVFGGPRKTVVFCAGVAHGADLAKKFADAGYNFVSLSYQDDDQFKQDAVAEFAKADSSIHGLIATDILTKGFDVSDVMIGVSARPFSKSLSSHIQQMGRVMRSHKGKDFALWLDHSGNYIRFQEDWDDIYESGVHELDDGKEKTKNEKTAAEKEAAKCPRCSHIWQSAAGSCPCCGFVRERRNTVTAVPGEMEELAGSGKLKQERREWYGQFLFVCRDRGYKPGWAASKFKEKFGSYPNGLQADPIPPMPEVSRWLKASHIRFMKSRHRTATA
ncbi:MULTISPECIES: DEAD/DEAH box helicase family protein [unclassified Variovorax]|uniref:DEAD/DEAH box helicase n=1 Tax=unclassified Variovorax TaxID=663243 RepID=UPI00076DAB63|nr:MULTISPECIES: DEAD/DEAH box helicase family protein [unclassified Variovorax]KWT71343.1 helicase-like protein [Variovorax sp. WDL1]PNG56013.1 putative DNA repair helicase RadD [Variovorax sp. B4]PNG57437.1 putative DNA repair helicase RadD [Variovorax sp. B2]VTV10188.1 UvsW helicase [Variovorax sp. WDL1]